MVTGGSHELVLMSWYVLWQHAVKILVIQVSKLEFHLLSIRYV